MNRDKIIYLFNAAGLIFLSLAFLTISAPRSWALYPLGLFLASGLVLWITDFRNNRLAFASNWYLIMPPVFYFIIHLVSIILQRGQIILLEKKLMFLLIPLLGFPLFRTDLFRQNTVKLLKAFTAGILIICIFLIVHSLKIVLTGYSNEVSFFSYIKENSSLFFYTTFSILEHPQYLAMKINWVIILMLYFKDELINGRPAKIAVMILFSIMIFLLSSKAGIILWLCIAVWIFINNKRNRSFRPIIYIVIIPLFLILSYFIIIDIERISYFLNTMKTELKSEKVDWKNLDQRTREWYSAIQLIKEKPVTGVGFTRVEERMVEEYLKNGWAEEASYKFNAHNQYLEAQMTFGIAGFLSLLWMLLTPVIFRKRLKYPPLAVVFVLMISFYLMFESMFNRQWGIMFFLLFNFILSIRKGIFRDDGIKDTVNDK